MGADNVNLTTRQIIKNRIAVCRRAYNAGALVFAVLGLHALQQHDWMFVAIFGLFTLRALMGAAINSAIAICLYEEGDEKNDNMV